jgi:hypothetical protein
MELDTNFAVTSVNPRSPLSRTLLSFKKQKIYSVTLNEPLETSPLSNSKDFSIPERKQGVEQENNVAEDESPVEGSPYSKTYSELRKIDLKRIGNQRVTRLIKFSIDHFSYKKLLSGDINPFEEKKFDSDSDADDNVDNDEFLGKKQEIQDVKKELALKKIISLEQREKILKLTFVAETLKTQVQNPTDVLHSSISRLKESTKISLRKWRVS